MSGALSPRAVKRMTALLKTLDRALDQMGDSAEISEIVSNWRGSMNIRDNIREFIDWNGRKL